MAGVMDLAAAVSFAQRLKGLGAVYTLELPAQAIVVLADALAASEQARVDTLEAHRVTLVDLAESEVRVARLEGVVRDLAPDLLREQFGVKR